MKRFGGVLLCAATIAGVIAGMVQIEDISNEGTRNTLTLVTGFAGGALLAVGFGIIRRAKKKA